MGKAEGKPTKPKKTRKKKVKKGPKRPATAFILYSKVARPKLRAENPDMAFGDLGKELGKRWKAMSDAEKKPYLDQNAKAKAEYAKAKAEWDKKNPKADKA